MPNAKSAPGTRQWAAWTRQEEENFFNALRQVGKVRGLCCNLHISWRLIDCKHPVPFHQNFEKITHRVQSKNKDQVLNFPPWFIMTLNMMLLTDWRNLRGKCYILDWIIFSGHAYWLSAENPEVTAISMLENYISKQWFNVAWCNRTSHSLSCTYD
jgi:hypothetical protein